MTLDSKLFKTQVEVKNNPLYISLRAFENLDLKTVGKDTVKNCDEAYAAYLKHCSGKTNPDFFKTICKFVILYREAFNQYGPEKYSSDDYSKQWEKDFFSHLHKKMYQKSFSEFSTTEFLPDIVNELFIFFQFHYRKLCITSEIMKELTLNFTSWLHKRELTSARVLT
mmetsp:Transcript_4013/g.3356  ORF Transcript_4013/g.3356 Transcript_4013/m.3356 type:complete len:168 (+) Transcript_4013:219-722(+)